MMSLFDLASVKLWSNHVAPNKKKKKNPITNCNIKFDKINS